MGVFYCWTLQINSCCEKPGFSGLCCTSFNSKCIIKVMLLAFIALLSLFHHVPHNLHNPLKFSDTIKQPSSFFFNSQSINDVFKSTQKFSNQNNNTENVTIFFFTRRSRHSSPTSCSVCYHCFYQHLIQRY
jgi:hypothetical protein